MVQPQLRSLCKAIALFFVGVLALTGAGLLGGHAGQANAQVAPSENQSQLSELTQSKIVVKVEGLMKDQGVPGLSIAIGRANQLLFSRGFGMADVENNVMASADTKYRTASIAKSLTATAIMCLVNDGKIDLDTDVQAYVPEYPKKNWPVTVRQLMGHLGGVRHYKYAGESNSTEHFFTLNSALSTFADDPLLHEPGTKYLYSSFGYNLLGSVAEGAGKQDFMSILNAHILEPALMSQTGADDSFAVVSQRSRGYFRPTAAFVKSLPNGHNITQGELYNSRLHDTSMKIPGGGLLSTAPDLIRFACALNSGKLVPRRLMDEMWNVQTTNLGSETGYGLGWLVTKQLGRQAVLHTGGQSGTSTVLLLFPDSGISIALMCNLENTTLSGLATSVASDVFQEQSEGTPSIRDADSTTDNAQSHQDVIQLLAAAVEYEVNQKQLPAFSMAIVEGDDVIWSKGYGFQDASRKVPATADTIYRVGSISKLLTDISIMKLVEQGALDLDVPVTDYLPNFKPNNTTEKPITLRMLMTHRSGLVRESPVGHYFDPDEPTLSQTVASLNGTPIIYEPGTRTKYSNAAIAVVGAVLESKLNGRHADLVKREIFDPLQMDSSSFDLTPAVAERLATSYMWTYDDRRFEAPSFLLGTGPAGNLYSTVLDLCKFTSFIFNDGKTKIGQVIKPETLKLMTTAQVGVDGNPQSFGIGFAVDDLDGNKLIGHGGAVYGFSTQLEVLPNRKLGVVAASALDGSNGVATRLSLFALRLMIAKQDGQPLPAYQQSVPISPPRAQAAVGLYQEVGGEQIARVYEFDGRCFIKRGSFRHELRADANDGTILTDDVFGQGLKIQLKDTQTLMVGETTYGRVTDKPPAEAPERWKGLIGEYGWDHNTLYILEDAGKLYALIEWFYYYPLTEVNENEFRFPDYGLYHGEGLRFTRPEQGDATEVVAAEVRFIRRQVGTQLGETFKIAPVTAIDDLRATALSATPPHEVGEYRESDFVDLTALDPTIKLDIRYASTNNFMGEVFYQQAKAFMQRPAAEGVVRANAQLNARGLGLLVHDAYRPWHVTKMFWDATPIKFKDFVANPANGSRHNRGCAVDITLYDLKTGKPIQMVAGYDEFSFRSFPMYPGGTSRQRWYRDLLRQTMEAEGFSVYEFEWWHFDFKEWQHYHIGNNTFEEVMQQLP